MGPTERLQLVTRLLTKPVFANAINEPALATSLVRNVARAIASVSASTASEEERTMGALLINSIVPHDVGDQEKKAAVNLLGLTMEQGMAHHIH